MRTFFIAIAICLQVASVALGQSPPRKPVVPGHAAQGDASNRLAEVDRERAEHLLRRYATGSKGLQVLLSDYVQRRSTALSKKPLVSSGRFLFVMKPACVVFRAEKPRVSVVRLTPENYEVFRPRRKRLERFELDGPELARGLFSALAGDADQLLSDFKIDAFSVVGGKRGLQSVRLAPKREAVKKRLRELSLTLEVPALRSAPVVLSSVAYRDGGGDLIEITFTNLRLNPKDAPSAELDVPHGTQVIEHKVAR